MYFPQAHEGVYGGGAKAKAAYSAEAYGRFTRPKSDTAGTLASLDAMVGAAEREWAGGRPYFVRVWHPGDANSYVELRRSYANDITMNLDQIYFDAASGAPIHRFQAAPVMTAQRFISGLHFIQHNHWTLRWLYFLAGLSGRVLIATGFLLLGLAFALCWYRDGASFGTLLWLVLLSAAAVAVALTLSWQAHWLLPAGWRGRLRRRR